MLEVCEQLGLSDIDAVYYASAVHDGDSFDTLFVAAPQPRHGLLALNDGKPLGKSALSRIPATAAYAAASRVDLAGAWDVIWTVLDDALPAPFHQEIARGLKQAEQQLGFSIRDGAPGGAG